MLKMTHRHSKELDIFYKEHRTNCTNCNKAFEDGMCAHLGYLPDKSPAVLCDDCASLLSETVVRYHWMRDEYEMPNPTDKLWRYMALGKFIHLVSSEKLYFASADSFEDPYEGAKGTIERKEIWDNYYSEFLRQAIKTVPGTKPEMLESDYVEKEVKRLLTEINQGGNWQRKHTFISCWHCNNYESEAMWKLYSVHTQNAIAIQTTAERLYQALDQNPYIDIGKVKYVDYNNRFTSINGACWYKRKSFEHEREVRAITKDFLTETKGLSIPINVTTLIETIYISPYAPLWFEEVVYSIKEKYEIQAPIVSSEMTKRPFY